MFEQPVLEIEDKGSFETVRGAIAGALGPAGAPRFLKTVDRERLRVRDFETILGRGLLGDDAKNAYGRLGNADQGQIRELYLASVEQVSPELRAKFLKVYAYYH